MISAVPASLASAFSSCFGGFAIRPDAAHVAVGLAEGTPWNKTTFVKDPETGKRTPVARPKHDWVVEERPHLAIVDGDLWKRVQARLETCARRTGRGRIRSDPGGRRRRCIHPTLCPDWSGARQRKKKGVVYRQAFGAASSPPRGRSLSTPPAAP